MHAKEEALYSVPLAEWLATHPPILQNCDLSGFFIRVPDTRFIDAVASCLGAAKVIEALRKSAGLVMNTFSPSVVEWCTKQGMQFNAEFIHRMMSLAAGQGDGPRMEHLLQLGGVWSSFYFRNALKCNFLTFCQWAHKRGDLDLDISLIGNIELYKKETVAWLASVGVYLPRASVTRDTFRQLAQLVDSPLLFVIEHYPRYVL